MVGRAKAKEKQQERVHSVWVWGENWLGELDLEEGEKAPPGILFQFCNSVIFSVLITILPSFWKEARKKEVSFNQ